MTIAAIDCLVHHSIIFELTLIVIDVRPLSKPNAKPRPEKPTSDPPGRFHCFLFFFRSEKEEKAAAIYPIRPAILIDVDRQS